MTVLIELASTVEAVGLNKAGTDRGVETMTLSESIVLYDSCHDIASRLRGHLLRLQREAAASGNRSKAQELGRQFDQVGCELRAVDPDNETQMEDCLASWCKQIHDVELAIRA